MNPTPHRRSLPRLVSTLLITSLGASPATAATADVQIDADDIGGVVASAKGPEAGVWVIAETDAFETRFAKIVVTDDQGRYLIPDLPAANYKVWVRGYGLADSAQSRGETRTTRRPRRGHRARRRHRGEGISRRVLVRDDEAARGRRKSRTSRAGATST